MKSGEWCLKRGVGLNEGGRLGRQVEREGKPGLSVTGLGAIRGPGGGAARAGAGGDDPAHAHGARACAHC